MKNIYLFITLFFVALFSYGQTQFGFKYNFKFNNFKSQDILLEKFNGHSIGISSLFFFTEKSDLLIQADYTLNSLTANSYKNYQEIDTPFIESIKVHNINLEILFNYYLIPPNVNEFQIGIQGGLGTTVLNKWEYSPEEDFFSGINNFKQYYILGISGGTEKIRLDIRYNKFFQDYLTDASVFSDSDSFNRSEERFINGTNNFFSIGLTYYFTNFLDNE